MAEVNTYWPSISTQQQIQERTRGWFESTVSAALYNRYNTKVSNQQEETTITFRNQLARRFFVRHYDKLG